MGDRGGGGQAAVSAPKLPRHSGMALREALHVKLVEDHPMRWNLRQRVAAPVEFTADHHALRLAQGIVDRIQRHPWVRLPALPTVAEARLAPIQLAGDRAGIRVQQQLGWVEPQTLSGPIRSVRAIAVKGSRPEPGHIAVPYVVELLGQIDA